MKIRHAAVLSLVAWYLMVPPLVPNTHEVNRSAPLSQWTIRRQFPRNQGCEAARDRLQMQGQAAQSVGDATGRRAHRNPESTCALCNAQCVEEGDSRLQAN